MDTIGYGNSEREIHIRAQGPISQLLHLFQHHHIWTIMSTTTGLLVDALLVFIPASISLVDICVVVALMVAGVTCVEVSRSLLI